MRSKNPLSSNNTEAAIRKAAQEWFVALLETPSSARQAEFETWLQSDPAHYEAYRAVESTWHATELPGERLAASEAAELAVYLHAMENTKKRKKTFRGLSTLSVVLMGLLAGAIWLERPDLLNDLTADYATARAERRIITMEDGSTIELDADSALSSEYAQNERRVKLLRGGAFFDIVPLTVPFIVETAEGEVRVLGTRFDVRLSDNGASVTLEHGRVAVSIENGAKAAILAPGQQVHFDATTIDPIKDVDVSDVLAWRDGRLVFYRARLSDVVREIGRYRKGRIVIATGQLADERVTGSFMLADSDAALASLQASVGFHMNTFAGRLTILRP